MSGHRTVADADGNERGGEVLPEGLGRRGGGRERTLRHQRMLSLFEQSEGRGLEIGPLFDPVVRRWESDVRYVDVHPGKVLKEYYATHPGVPVDEIVDPDFVLIGPEGVRTLPEAVRGAEPFDWVVASHVIEHVPDVIGWLSDVAEILVDEGRLVLAVPDRRFSFDAARVPTTVGEMLLASHHRDRIPSVRAIYDHYHGVVSINAADAWRGHEPGLGDRIHDLDYVRRQLELAVNDRVYVDCHVWLFTPQSFVDQLAELAGLDRIEFVVEKIIPTAVDELEFYVALRRLPRHLATEDRAVAFAAGFAHSGLDEDRVHEANAENLHPFRIAAAPGQPPLDVVSVSAREQQLLDAKRALMRRIRTLESRIRRYSRRSP